MAADRGIPQREGDFGGHWARMPDAELWSRVAARDSVVVIGLKSPGQARGVWRGTILIGARERSEGHGLVRGTADVGVLDVDPLFPRMRVRVRSLGALGAVRRIPHLDYIEPAVLDAPGSAESPAPSRATRSTGSHRAKPRFSSGGSSGCDTDDTWDGQRSYTASGDVLPPRFARHGITEAWKRSQGAGVVVGITDTGISAYQPQLSTEFVSGQSTGRWYFNTSVISGGTTGLPAWHDECGHGTEIAGVIAAPMDGRNVVGAAYRANVVAVRQANGVAQVDIINAAQAIRAAASLYEAQNPHRRIVQMAWGTMDPSNTIADEIRYWYARERLFIASSGTSWSLSAAILGVVFPATMSEVIAVSAINSDFSPLSTIHYGSKVEISAIATQVTTGYQNGVIAQLGASSGTSALVSGIAALTWSRYPAETRDQIRQRLRLACSIYPSRNDWMGYGVIDAWKAVGGLHTVGVSGPDFVYPDWGESTATFSVGFHGGDGPFTYLWYINGDTNHTTTYGFDPTLTEFTVTVSVTDHSDGTTVFGSKLVKVHNDNCTTCPH